MSIFLRLILPVLLAPCACWASAGAAPEETVAVGFVADFSDVSQAYTRNMYGAFELAIDDLNAAGGVNGQTVRVIVRDGGNDAERHGQLVQALIREERVVAVFGGASSPCVLQASAVCRQERIPYLVSIGNSESIVVEHGHPYVFLFEPNVTMESKSFSVFVTLMPWRRYAWIGPDYTWGRDILRCLKQHFRDIGARVEWTTEAWHPLGATEYDGLLREVIAGQPDAIVISSWGEDVRRIMQQANPQDLFQGIAVFGWCTYDVTVDSEGLLPAGMWVLSRGPFNYLADQHPQTRAFVERFQERTNAYPNGFTICCYDSLLAWRRAVGKARSTEPEAVAQALRGLKFVSLRGDSLIRAVDGQMDCPTYFGRLAQVPEYSVPVWTSVIEVPARKTWLSEQEVLNRRASAPR